MEKNKSMGINLNSHLLPKISNKLSTYASTHQSRISQFQRNDLTTFVRQSIREQQSRLMLDRSRETIEELTQNLPKIYQKHLRVEKCKSLECQENKQCSLEEAEKIWRNSNKQSEERSKACKFIAETYLNKAYGNELPKIDSEFIRKVPSTKNKLNTKILAQILNEIQHNSRSHSILIRKSELQQLQNDYSCLKEGQKSSRFRKVNLNNQQQRFQMLYKLKNQYSSLKDLIITSKNQEYDDFIACINNEGSSCDFRKTMKSNRGGTLKKTIVLPELQAEKENCIGKELQSNKTIEYQSLPKVNKMNSDRYKQQKKFENSNNKLTIQNCGEVNPKIFLYMTSRLHFQSIKAITLKQLWFQSDLLLFLLDCVRGLGSHTNVMDFFECSSMKVANLNKFSDKLSSIFEYVPIKVIKLEFLDLTNRQVSKIAESLHLNPICQTVSFRHNKIDLLGLRYIQELARNNNTIKSIDLRNNEIPHYANLKGKIKSIQFF